MDEQEMNAYIELTSPTFDEPEGQSTEPWLRHLTDDEALEFVFKLRKFVVEYTYVARHFLESQPVARKMATSVLQRLQVPVGRDGLALTLLRLRPFTPQLAQCRLSKLELHSLT